MKFDLRKIYRFEAINHPAEAPLPSGGDIYYECTECTHVVSSVPHIVSHCECGNLHGKGGTVEIKDAAKVRAVRGKLK